MKALVIAAHPDDEVLGAGATVAALTAGGAEVSALILAEGISLRHSGITLEQARDTCHKAARELGVTTVRFGGFAQDGILLGDVPQRLVVDAVAGAVREFAPELVFTHHPGDIHVDHRVVAHSTTYATRILSGGSVRQVLHYEVMSSTDQQTGLVAPFLPTVYYDVDGFVDAKCRALAAYSYEVFPPPHPRSEHGVRALAGYRGAQVGLPAAESFALGRELREVAQKVTVSGGTR